MLRSFVRTVSYVINIRSKGENIYIKHHGNILEICNKKKGEFLMKHVKTLNTKKLQNTIKKGGCGECQTSCQSACKTSCTVGNQTCEQK